MLWRLNFDLHTSTSSEDEESENEELAEEATEEQKKESVKENEGINIKYETREFNLTILN